MDHNNGLLELWVSTVSNKTNLMKIIKNMGLEVELTTGIDGKYFASFKGADIKIEVTPELHNSLSNEICAEEINTATMRRAQSWADENKIKVFHDVIFKVVDQSDTKFHIKQLESILEENNVKMIIGGLSKRVWVSLPENGLRAAGQIYDPLIEPEIKTGILEFLGFSRIDGLPIFKAYRTYNNFRADYKYDQSINTFSEYETVQQAFEIQSNSHIGGFKSGKVKIELVGALEDHIAGFKL